MGDPSHQSEEGFIKGPNRWAIKSVSGSWWVALLLLGCEPGLPGPALNLPERPAVKILKIKNIDAFIFRIRRIHVAIAGLVQHKDIAVAIEPVTGGLLEKRKAGFTLFCN